MALLGGARLVLSRREREREREKERGREREGGREIKGERERERKPFSLPFFH